MKTINNVQCAMCNDSQPRKMKDSGIEWIGEIPEEWQTIKFKYLHNQSNVGNSIDKDYWTSEENDTVFYTAGLYPIHTSYKDFPTDKYTTQNDILLARNGTPYVYFPITGAAYSDHIIRVELHKDYCKRYMGLCLQQSINYEIVDTVSIATWSVSIWDKQFLCLPPYDEQQAIAAHLDRICSEIDSVTAKTKATIEEYKKLKQAVITEAVTKGIRKGRKMKDSGVEWIGEIPEEWEKCRIKHIFSTYSGATPKSEKEEYWDGDVIWITPADFKTEQVYIEKGKRTITFEGYKSCGTTLIPPNSIVFSKRAPIGTVVINTKELCTNQGCLSCVKSDMVSEKYYYYLFSIYTEIFELLGSGTTFKEISFDNFINFVIVKPGFAEQQEIAAFLDEKCAAIDSLIAKKEQLLTELESYKKSVIYEYVTGKREVG